MKRLPVVLFVLFTLVLPAFGQETSGRESAIRIKVDDEAARLPAQSPNTRKKQGNTVKPESETPADEKIPEEADNKIAEEVPVETEQTKPTKTTKKKLIGGAIQAAAGSFFGGMNEFVYNKGYTHELSRLEWEENFVPCLALDGELRVWNFYLDAGFKTAIPMKGGAMRDYDYMIPGVTDPSLFSEHDAMLDRHFEADASLAYRFDFGFCYLAPGAGFFYRGRKWTAMDGYTKYPTEESDTVSDDTPEVEIGGSIITYQETTWMPSVSLDAGFVFGGGFSAGLRAVYYPYMHIDTVDTHILTLTRYHDVMAGMGLFAVAGEIWLRYRPPHMERLGFTLAGGWQGVFPGRGTTEGGVEGGPLVLDTESQSRSESSKFWVNLGVGLYF